MNIRCSRQLPAELGRLVFASFVVALLWVSATAQVPDKFTNLQVLPKDIPKDQLIGTMRSFAFALGVRCEHCHVQGADKKLDFAADAKEPKKIARTMIQMVSEINQQYLSKIGRPAPVQVECMTCHRGLTQPRTLNAVLAEATEKDGITAAVSLYHNLRKQYYGTGAYDFGETPLNVLTESFLSKKMNKEAAAIMEMNVSENSPPSMWAYHLLAMSHRANGEIDKAREDFRKDLALYPGDDWAKTQLESMSTPK